MLRLVEYFQPTTGVAHVSTHRSFGMPSAEDLSVLSILSIVVGAAYGVLTCSSEVMARMSGSVLYGFASGESNGSIESSESIFASTRYLGVLTRYLGEAVAVRDCNRRTALQQG